MFYEGILLICVFIRLIVIIYIKKNMAKEITIHQAKILKSNHKNKRNIVYV